MVAVDQLFPPISPVCPSSGDISHPTLYPFFLSLVILLPPFLNKVCACARVRMHVSVHVRFPHIFRGFDDKEHMQPQHCHLMASYWKHSLYFLSLSKLNMRFDVFCIY